MDRILQALMYPLIAVSWFAGPVGGIWLAIRGDWWAIGYAILSIFVSPSVLGLALMPALLLAAPAAIALERRPRLGTALGIPALVYTAALMTAWCILVLRFFLSRADSENWFPLMLLGVSVAGGPWGYMAAEEAKTGGGEGASLAVFFMNLALAASCVLLLLDRFRPVLHIVVAFGVIMAVQVLVAAWLANRVAVASQTTSQDAFDG